MSKVLTTRHPSELSKYSSDCAGQVIKQALSDMKKDFLISLWSEDITKTAVHLAKTYGRFTEKFYGCVLCEAVEKYSEHYTLVNHFIPWADSFAKDVIKEGLMMYSQCNSIYEKAFECSRDEMRRLAEIRKIERWADAKVAALLDVGVTSLAKRKSQISSTTNFDAQKNCEDPCQSYAHSLVDDLFSSLKVRDYTFITISNSSQSDKSKSSHCGSCESISSDLLSPHSTADSSGLHHFADKLLYSLSALENTSTESISSTETTDTKYSIVDCFRRSSAPELRVSSRKSSLKTVFEEMPVECPGTTKPVLKTYPATSLGRRLRSSEERRCASMESIDGMPSRASYSETLAKNILFSAYKDVM